MKKTRFYKVRFRTTILITLLNLLTIHSIFAQHSTTSIEVLVTNSAELNDVITKAVPGSTIKLKNGTWNDVHIHFKGKGTEQSPITLVAEKSGEVVLTGNSYLTIEGDYLVVDGLYFKDGLLKGSAPVVEFTKSSTHCQLTNTAIVDYNHTEKTTRRRWVTVDGSHHKVDHCLFKGKTHMGPLLRNMPGSKYNHFFRNYFVDIPVFPENGLEIIQVMSNAPGGEPTKTDGEYLLIEYNLFERAHGESAEIISLKSSFNTVRHNMVRNTKGGFVIRSGHFNLVTDNYIESDGSESGTAGIRMTGEGNKVTNNLIKGVSNYGIVLMAGEFIDSAITKDWVLSPNAALPNGRVAFYNQTQKSLVENNVLINNKGTDLWVGYNYMDKWPRYQYVLLPKENIIRDNLVVKRQGISYRIEKPATEFELYSPSPNYYSENKLYADSKPDQMNAGIEYVSFQEFDENKILSQHKPLSKEDVGPVWMRKITDNWFDNIIQRSEKQLLLAANNFKDSGKNPRTFEHGKVQLVTERDWTSGFFPGSLWYLYELTGNEALKTEAARFTTFVEKAKYRTNTHDLGFILNCSFGNAYRLTAKKAYKEVMILKSQTPYISYI
jgi:poly(beta-D-mannuronate) lyase